MATRAAKKTPAQKKILADIKAAEARIGKLMIRRQHPLITASIEANRETIRALWDEYRAAA